MAGILKTAVYPILLAGTLLSFTIKLSAQNEQFKVFLVGDAGENRQTGETLRNLHVQLINNPNSAVIFLGDNAYKSILWGIIPFGFKGFDGTALSQKKVRSQLDILAGYKGYVYFVPGNHDWWNIKSKERGKRKLKLEEDFIEQVLQKNGSIANPTHTFLPADGNPGPDYVELGDRSVRIIFIDTYRLIMEGFKENSPEDSAMENNFYRSLDKLLHDATLQRQRVIIAAHHPVYAKGPNNGPLKHPRLFKRIKASNIHFHSYSRMAASIKAILNKYPGIYYASGHVHTLQYYLSSDSIHYIVSGAGSKIDHVPDKEIQNMPAAAGNEYKMWNMNGFFEIEFYKLFQKTFLFYDNGQSQCELE